MAKDKKYKGGPARKSYLQNMAKQGGRSGEYSKFGDYDPKDVHDSTIDYTHRGRQYSLEQSATDKDIWARNLVTRLGKSVGDAFRHNGTLYTIGEQGGMYHSREVKV
jgi:hypothetical protein